MEFVGAELLIFSAVHKNNTCIKFKASKMSFHLYNSLFNYLGNYLYEESIKLLSWKVVQLNRDS